MKKLIQEAHRRSLWQVLGIYLFGSWVVLQVVDVLAENMTLPDWVFPFALVLLLIGLPIVMATAFVQEGLGSQAEAASDAAEAEPVGSAIETSDQGEGGEHASAPSAIETGGGKGRNRILTWRNALLGGAAAFTLLGVVTAGWIITRTAGIGPAATLVAQGVLDERAPILLADFESEDAELSRVATEAFRIDLSQSDMLRLAEPVFVADVLVRMQREPDAPLDRELAREVAQREGIQAVIAGEINSAGGSHLLSAQVISTGDGQVLASHRENASDSTAILAAIDELSEKLRERIGESLRSISRDSPLERVTTANLEALRRYSQAVRALEVEAEEERGIALLEEAVAEDPEFAMAWRKLGVSLNNRQEQRARQVEALMQAHEFRDRLTERERYMTIATYHQMVTGDIDQSITAYENLLEVYPDYYAALNNLGGRYMFIREPERAEVFFRRAIRADSLTSSFPYANLINALVAQGEFEDAHNTVDELVGRFPGNLLAQQQAALLSAVERDYDAARQHHEQIKAASATSPFWRTEADNGLTSVAALLGQLGQAERRILDLVRVDEERGQPERALGSALRPAWWQMLVREDPVRAVEVLETTLERFPLSQFDPLDRPYLELVSFYAQAERVNRAKELLAEYESSVPPELRGQGSTSALHRAQGEILLAEGLYREAITELQHGDEVGCRLCALPGLAAAFEAAGLQDSAVATYRRYLETPWMQRLYFDHARLAPTFERLGQLYDEQEDWEKAAEYYAKFVELWSEADPDLQPRVEAAQRRIEAIFAERG
jgi:tetratricopeptide (TPR) repeat protein